MEIMKKCDENCNYFCTIANTDETMSAICKYTSSYFPVYKDADCVIIPKNYTCGDCDRLGKDDWCLTCHPEDSAYHEDTICCGFIDKRESDVFNALCDWSLRGYDIEEKLNKVLEDFQREFKPILNT